MSLLSRAGRLVNINQTEFASLTQMVQTYESPHPDMQTVLSEYVPCKPDTAGTFALSWLILF